MIFVQQTTVPASIDCKYANAGSSLGGLGMSALHPRNTMDSALRLYFAEAFGDVTVALTWWERESAMQLWSALRQMSS